MDMDNKPEWCPQDLWDETSSAFNLLYESEPDLEGGCEYGIRSMAAAVAMVAIATERERAAKVVEAYPPDQFFRDLFKRCEADDESGYILRLEGDTGNWAAHMSVLLASCAAAIRATPNQTGEVDRT